MVVSSEERPIILREHGGKMAEMLPVNFAKWWRPGEKLEFYRYTDIPIFKTKRQILRTVLSDIKWGASQMFWLAVLSYLDYRLYLPLLGPTGQV